MNILGIDFLIYYNLLVHTQRNQLIDATISLSANGFQPNLTSIKYLVSIKY